ncbi:CDP-glycerol glycerophosphotransferase family protein [Streptomyces sp. N2-109]|uniref:CDP-glycerol glycerophosphotransferase family protein n=1 Tax=Streptomyces gossypii TaxID=2883101 RepID=A0ABT2JSM5_9ACTN|nr:CDP-glycerol glycerophosphotransferase family protein [Streptomyces gossypii]MCT2590892.1 CDP-glycerol glycerophosphotransferase family protein [Streptomyces gossypii]
MTSRPEDILPPPLRRLLRFFPEGTPEERAELLAGAKELRAKHSAKALGKLPPVERVKWYLAAEERTEDLTTVLRFERQNSATFHVTGVRHARLEIPGLDTGSLPDEVALLSRRELPVVSRVTDLQWSEDGALTVRGYAYLTNVPVASKRRTPRLAVLRREGSRRAVPLRMKSFRDSRATRDSKQGLHSYDWSGFEFTVSPRQFKTGGKWATGKWEVGTTTSGPGGIYAGRIEKTQVGAAGHGLVRTVEDGVRLVAGFTEGRLEFSVDLVPAEVASWRVVKDSIELDIRTPARAGGVRPAWLRMETVGGGDKHTYPVEQRDGRHYARVPCASLSVAKSETEKTTDFRPVILLSDGTERRATVADSLLTGTHPMPGGREIAIATDARGLLKLHDRMRQGVVDRMEWSDGTLVLEGAYSGTAAGKRLVLRHGESSEEKFLPVKISGGRFTARIRPEEMDLYGMKLPLRQGRWYLSLRGEDATREKESALVKLRADLLGTLPLKHPGSRRMYSVERRFFDRIFLESGPVLGDDERGSYRQRRLKNVHAPQQRELPLKDQVIYNSYHGRQFSDSPKAIYEELVRRGTDVEHVWAVGDQRVEVPEGVRVVEWHSAEWYAEMSRSRYVVTNVMLNSFFKRREGQRVVQTWHGTPLKKMGAHIRGTTKANPAYIETLPGRSNEWEVMVTPNAFTTPIMREAFGFENEILECGYPRNDIFYRGDRRKIAAEVRERLGIPAGKKVLLYVPTWRDDVRIGTGKKFKLDFRVDLAAAQRELGDDYVFLFRKHPKIVDNISGAGNGFVWDVSDYPEIEHLYLIADVLITDYSSAMFDYAHSGRPMLFFTYDLEHYRDNLRGFYFDFIGQAPGPLLKTSEELVGSIRDIDKVAVEYREKYAEFVQDFCQPADGLASSRVVDWMLGPHGAEGSR